MKTETTVLIFFIVMILSAGLIYYGIVTVNRNKKIEQHNKICSTITDEMNANINESSSFVSYYCYYKPYKAPEGMENVETLCICEGRLKNGSTKTVQILANDYS